MAKTLGILGGLGPAASVYFYQMITEHTSALRDQDHIDIVLISGAGIPDRSDFILGKSDQSPLPVMKEDVLKLAHAGADLIAIPCNTAHYFFDELEKISPVPVLNIVKETVKLAKRAGVHKLGILATTGTVVSGAYQRACTDIGTDYLLPSDDSQEALMHMIYQSIKTAKRPDTDRFLGIAAELYAGGCDAVVLGCTELSLIPQTAEFEPYRFIDSLLVLARKSILECGKIPCGFPDIYTYMDKAFTSEIPISSNSHNFR